MYSVMKTSIGKPFLYGEVLNLHRKCISRHMLSRMLANSLHEI